MTIYTAAEEKRVPRELENDAKTKKVHVDILTKYILMMMKYLIYILRKVSDTYCYPRSYIYFSLFLKSFDIFLFYFIFRIA